MATDVVRGARAMIIVLGARGRLGSALVAALPADTVAVLPREVYARWSESGAVEAIARLIERTTGGRGVIVVASGVTDPSLPPEIHENVNFLLTRNVIEAAARVGVRAVTLGTVMETLVPPEAANPYLRSKQLLSDFVGSFDAGAAPEPLHVRIHTLYGGGLPAPHMFLGQMLTALSSGKTFRMSSGRQLREYHHVQDDAEALLALLAAGRTGIVTLSHGQPVTLKALASAVFEALGASRQLAIGAIADPPADNYSMGFPIPPCLRGIQFREAISNVALYLRSCLEVALRNESGGR
jgi:nucleoside-diphosphate-sugar epimerase